MSYKKLTTWQTLRNRFPESEYVLLEEVSDAAGHQRSRSLDFMIINLWQSRGLAVNGIERKSNRGDWLKELKNPQKQENHFKFCDYFWLLTDKEGVAKIDEIPANWGWYHINEKGILKTMKPAPKLKSIPIERSLLCAMLRRAACKTGFIHADSVASHIEEKVIEICQKRDAQLQRDAAEYNTLKKKVVDFEKHSGLNITYAYDDDMKDIGKIVNAIRSYDTERYLKDLKNMERNVKYIYENIGEKIAVLEASSKPA